MKKILLSSIGFGTTLMALGVVVSCSNKTQEINKDSYVDDKGIVFSSSNKKNDTNFGLGNYAKPELTNIDNNNKMETIERRKTGQPFGLHFHARDMVDWDYKNDADRHYAKGTIKLNEREWAEKILSSQKEKKFDVLAGLSSTTSRMKAGTLGINEGQKANIFSMWSSINSIIGWGGSTSEGNFVLPKGQDINAAHKNGVPIFATLFLAPSSFGGNKSQYEIITTMNGNKYPVADSMIEQANYYGFDGWYLNLETPLLDSGKISKLQKFLKYLHKGLNEKNKEIILYDYETGYKLMNSNNQDFDIASMDYGSWGKEYGINKNKYSYGYEYDQQEIKGNNKTGSLKWDDKNIWMYTFFRRHDAAIDGRKKEFELFVDSEGSKDPRHIGGDNWKEVQKFFSQRTTLTNRKEFYTDFEMGWGSSYYSNGIKMNLNDKLIEDGYRNGGLQSLLPTYQWINDEYDASGKLVSTPGNKIEYIDNQNKQKTYWESAIKENGDAWSGSFNLNYTGKIKPLHSIVSKLYATKWCLKEGDEIEITVRGSDEPELALWEKSKTIQTKPNYFIKNKQSLKEDLGNNFTKIHYLIPKNMDGKYISSFGLKFINDNKKDVKSADYNISAIKYRVVEKNKKEIIQNKIKEINQDGSFTFDGNRNIRFNWKMDNNAPVSKYEIYSTKKIGNDYFVKNKLEDISSLPATYIKNVASSPQIRYVIDAYDSQGNKISSNKVIIRTDFKSMDDLGKWSVKYKDDPSDKIYIKNTNNGYTSVLKDEADESIFIADDYTRIHKITSSGDFWTSGNQYWGTKSIKEGKDTKVIKMMPFDKENILAITHKGDLFKFDKNTGKSKIITPRDRIINSINKKEGSNESEINITKILDMKVVNGTIKIVIKVKYETLYKVFEIVVDNKNISTSILKNIEHLSKNNNDTIISYRDSNRNLNISIQTNQIKASSFIEDDKLQKSLDEYFDKYKNADDPRINFKLSRGEVVYSKQINEDLILFINEWGIIFTTNKKGEIINISHLYGGEKYRDLKNKITVLNSNPGFDKGDGIQKILEKLSGKIINGDSVSINDNILTIASANDFKFNWWGNASITKKIDEFDISDLLNATNPIKVTLNKSLELEKEEDKTIGDLRFSLKNKGMLFVFGNGKFAIYNNDSKIIPFGSKEYSYNGKTITSLTKLFDDGDKKIPVEFTK